jgi:hypothetical protein
MLFLFDQGRKAKDAVEKINDTYANNLKLNKCHRWIKNFKNGKRELRTPPEQDDPKN